jgi:thiol:disulfide interchange protein
MTEREHDRPSPSADPNAKACASAGACPLRGRWGLLLWALVIGGFLYMQWPMMKGAYYKATGAKAPASAVAWRTGGFDAALAESARTGKPVLADFSASWCPPCKVMKFEVWPNPAVARAANEGYVPVLIDVDDPQNAEVAQRYGIRGIPTVLVLDAKGQVLKSGSYMSKGDMLDFLDARA